MALLKILFIFIFEIFFLTNFGYGQSTDVDPCADLQCEKGFYCQPYEPNCTLRPCPVIPPKCVSIPTDRGCEKVLDNPCDNDNIKCLRGYYCQPQYTPCDAEPDDQPGPKCMPIPLEDGTPLREYSPCSNVTCPAGTYCSFTIIYCITTPCNQPPPVCKLISE